MACSVATDSDKAWEGPIYYKHKGTFVAVSQRTSLIKHGVGIYLYIYHRGLLRFGQKEILLRAEGIKYVALVWRLHGCVRCIASAQICYWHNFGASTS